MSFQIYIWPKAIALLELFKNISRLPLMVKVVIYSGFFGLSFMIASLIDALKVLTVHNYFFYIYALRIYKIEVESLKSLFRLFRGKKLNPLRARIDSYSFEVDQLFIGTIGFCIALFLLPTILLYYFVFLTVSSKFETMHELHWWIF